MALPCIPPPNFTLALNLTVSDEWQGRRQFFRARKSSPQAVSYAKAKQGALGFKRLDF